jgi:hypothetical protein
VAAALASNSVKGNSFEAGGLLTKRWQSRYITRQEDLRSRNQPIDFAEEAPFLYAPGTERGSFGSMDQDALNT